MTQEIAKTTATATAALPNPEETKIVITHKDNRALVGISKTGCDPIFFIAAGELNSAVTLIPGYVQQAREKWQTFQRYPKSMAPPPPSAATQARPITAAAAQKKEPLQPRMY
jgi:hypothetical protein